MVCNFLCVVGRVLSEDKGGSWSELICVRVVFDSIE